MFTTGFLKTAKYDESKEYEQANEVDRHLSKLKPAGIKAGERVAYHSSERGWKEGPWAKHTKGCSMDEEIGNQREEHLKKSLKEAKLPEDFKKIKGEGMKAKQDAWRNINRSAHDKFPMHHSCKNWNKEAIGIGDLGRISKVEKGTILPSAHVVWDKHPECTWGGYSAKDLKIAPEGM